MKRGRRLRERETISDRLDEEMKACASMSGDPIEGSAGKTLDMLPPRQQTRSGRTDGRTDGR